MTGVVLLIAGAAQAQTYTQHIAPILEQYCVECHRTGEAAPFALTSYDAARKHAAQMAKVTHSRYMPPWPPEPGFGEFHGARRLTEAQLKTIQEWAAAGAPKGPETKEPIRETQASGWKLGRPDLIVKMPAVYNLPASDADVFRNFIIPVEIKQPRYVRAVELHPGNPKVVHHANIIVDRTRSLRSRDHQDGQPGFSGMDVETESGGVDFEPDSHFLFWKPGTIAQPEPEDMAWRLDPGTDLVVNLHLKPSGKAEAIQAEIGLYFTDRAPTRLPMLVQLEHDGAIDVLPGKQAAVTDELKLPVATKLLAIYPHAHYIGKRIEAWAILPDGKRMELIRINDWDINWQAAYTYKNPVELPANTRVAMRITYDNRAENPRNPSHPPKRVRVGNRSEDEMGHVWLQLLPAKKEERLDLQVAVMRRRLEKYPMDFLAHYNLGAALQTLEQFQEAEKYLAKAVRLKPDNLTARNTLGVNFLLTDQLERAAGEFRNVLKLDPTYVSARFNLGRALAALSDVGGAIAEFEALLATAPDDAKAHNQLAGILAASGRVADSIPHFRKAAELEPGDADTWTNLGTALAISGDLKSAVKAFETALAIDPKHAGAKDNLARAQAALR